VRQQSKNTLIKSTFAQAFCEVCLAWNVKFVAFDRADDAEDLD